MSVTAHHRSEAALCLLYKIRWNPMHPCYVPLPGPHVPALVTHGARSHIGILIRLLAAVPRSTAEHLFIPLSVSLLNDLADPVFDCVGLSGFKSRANAFFLA